MLELVSKAYQTVYTEELTLKSDEFNNDTIYDEAKKILNSDKFKDFAKLVWLEIDQKLSDGWSVTNDDYGRFKDLTGMHFYGNADILSYDYSYATGNDESFTINLEITFDIEIGYN